MTKLEQLIEELCPNGVEYRTLNTICNVYDGTHQTPQYTDSGIKFASVENIADPYATEKYISVSDYEKYKIKPQRNDLLMTRIGSIGVCTVIESDEPLAYYVSLALLRPDNSILNSRYLKYAIESLHCRKELRKRTLVNAVPIKINMGDIGKITLPVPPLPVQREIVRILDNFTELTAELTAEFAARRKQYEYYRDELLAPISNMQYTVYTLGDIATVTKLAGFEFTNYVIYSNEGEIIALRGLNVKNGKLDLNDVKYIDNSDLTKLTRSKLHTGDMLFTYVGTIGQVAVIDEDDKYYLAPNVALIRCDKNIISPEYMRYYFQSSEFWDTQINKLLQSSSMKNIPMGKIRKFKLCIPPVETQCRIVNILDRFDALCNDITSGLPAEIEARKKQYEYYRDKLLSFKSLSRNS